MKNKLGKIIAVCNQKGGVGKTTTTINIGIGLAQSGGKVLLVDADSQASLTSSLGWVDTDSIPIAETLAGAMAQTAQGEIVNLKNITKVHREGIDLIPSNIGLADFEVRLTGALSREHVLKNTLTEAKEEYDYILIDCMPSLGLITLNALTAAESVIVPVQLQYLSALGMSQLLATIGRVQRQLNPDLDVRGILLTMVGSTNLAKKTRAIIKEKYGDKYPILKSEIPISVRAGEASAAGISMYAFAPENAVAIAYEEAVQEIEGIVASAKKE